MSTPKIIVHILYLDYVAKSRKVFTKLILPKVVDITMTIPYNVNMPQQRHHSFKGE